MKREFVSTFAVAVLLGCTVVAAEAAVTLDFLPSSPDVTLGVPLSVDVVVSGLGDLQSPSLGAFDLSVEFDAAVLAPSAVLFGDALGDVTLLEATAASTVFPGSISFFGLSFLSELELDARQPGTFSLASLVFDTTAPGTSPLSFSSVILGDAFGAPIDVDASAGSVVVRSVLAEPHLVLLLGAGLLAFGLFSSTASWHQRHG